MTAEAWITQLTGQGEACLLYIYALKHSMLNKKATSEDICSDLHLLTYSLQQLIWSATKQTEDKSILVGQSRRSVASRLPNKTTPHKEKPETLIGKLMAIVPLFPHVVQALDRLGQDPANQRLQRFAIYAVVKTFQNLVEAISNVACTRNSSPTIDGLGGKEAPRGRSKRNTSSDSTITMIRDESLAARLCQLFIAMLACLQTSNQAHMEVLEGVLFHFLDKVGQLLRSATVDVHTSPVNGNIDIRNPTSGLGAKGMAIQAQAPYLIWLLKQMLKISDEDSRARCQNRDATRELPRGIMGIPRLKLQHTLLRAVFGENSVGFDTQSLRPPILPCDSAGVIQLDSKLGSVYPGARLTMEFWKILGWDVLRESIGV